MKGNPFDASALRVINEAQISSGELVCTNLVSFKPCETKHSNLVCDVRPVMGWTWGVKKYQYMDLIGLNTSRDYHNQSRKYPWYSPTFKNAACCENALKDNKDNSPRLSLQISCDICPCIFSGPQSSQFSSRFVPRKLFLRVKRNRLCRQSNITERIFAPTRDWCYFFRAKRTLLYLYFTFFL